jgi:hypothetical protein
MFRKRTEKLLSGMGLDPSVLQQARQAMSPEGVRAQMEYRNRVQRIMASGDEMPATIRAFTLGAPDPGLGGHSVQLEMEIEPPGGAAYAASFDQALPPTIVSTLASGQRVTVKVARDDPQVVMLWNTPHVAGGADPDTGRPLAPATAAPGEDRIARLEKLQELRTSGVLTEEEFEAQKAKILAS